MIVVELLDQLCLLAESNSDFIIGLGPLSRNSLGSSDEGVLILAFIWLR